MDCVFCKIISGEFSSYKLYEDDKVIVILAADPVVDGHSLVIPKEHVEDITCVSKELLSHMYDVAMKMTPVLMEKMNATAITYTFNYGDSQSVKHLHLHLLPDYTIKTASKSMEEVFNIITK
jgi:histidine triad (HIT) family protein